jgi:hypothetical protein
MSRFKLTDNREKCISVAALVADVLVDEGYLSKEDATLVFDALAEGLMQQDISTPTLVDIEALMLARVDEPGDIFNDSIDYDTNDSGDETH